MSLQFIIPLGAGAFGDVWKAEDELGRTVAVKLFHASAEALSSALDHARALARVSHPNVVRVLHITTEAHPTSQDTCQCVVMELVEGTTLTNHLSGSRLQLSDARALGLSILDGLAAIHSAGLPHGDLHADNVMVKDGQAKIIDILYRGSLADLSTSTRESRLRSDLTGVRLLLVEVLHNSVLDPGEATHFNNLLRAGSALAEIRDAWSQVTDPEVVAGTDRLVNHALRRIRDRAFVESDAYAIALADEIPASISTTLFRQLIAEGGIDAKHRAFLRMLASRIPDEDLPSIMAELGRAIDDETPDGAWYSPLQLLAATGRRGWNLLAPSTAIRLEHVIVNDVLSGRYDIHSYPNLKGGVLGTHANTFYDRFREPEQLFENLTSMLHQSWYTQNYVAEYLLKLLVRLATTPAGRARALVALGAAINNDARIVKHRLHVLPPDWQAELTSEDESDDLPF